MTKRLELVQPRDERGNDANDFRNDPDYLEKLHSQQAAAPDPLAWAGTFTMTDEQIEQLADPEWIYRNLLISGHLVAIVAPPNGGKTTLFEWIAAQISDAYRVLYVNADISGADAKFAYRRAKAGNYTLLLPDMLVGQSMTGVVSHLVKMNKTAADLSDMVLIFDTLKKMTNVIHKEAAKALYKTLRQLTAKGATIVLLAHTNKHRGDDGAHVYEGTGDLRADVDELIYLEPVKHDDGSMTVSTRPDKIRGDFRPISFEISPNRQVTPLEEFVDTAAERERAEQLVADHDDIEVIHNLLQTGAKNQSELVKACRTEGLSRRRVLTLLRRYSSGQHAPWQRRTDPNTNNASIYSIRVPSMSGTAP